jgi:ribonuclease HI
MELTAVIRGLQHLVREDVASARVISDSQYVIRGLSEWCHTWRKNDWKRKDDNRQWVDVGNIDLWKIAFGLAHHSISCEFEWQRGHIGERFNERCDELAGEQAWALIEK